MALHGEVKINGQVIAWWGAQRVSGGTEPDDVNRYDARVCMAGGPMVWTGQISHRYGDGAVALAAAVLAAAEAAGHE